jgi:hypothetical protein
VFLSVFGSDGATYLIRSENGLIRKIMQNISHLICVLCLAHRLNLIVLSSVKNLECTDELDSVLQKLYKFHLPHGECDN